jgi:hypothetical protein
MDFILFYYYDSHYLEILPWYTYIVLNINFG